MTSLSGEFQTDLRVDDAMVACTEAIDGLGWRIDTVDAQRVIAFTDSGEKPPRIEVNLNESGDGTEFRIIGSDNEQNQLEQEELISVLDQARDAINRAMEDAERPSEAPASSSADQTEEKPQQQSGGDGAAAAPAGWYPDAYDDSRQRYWDGEQWTDDFRPADGAADSDGGEAPKVDRKKSRKENRAERREQSRERAEKRRQERLEKRKQRAQQSGTESSSGEAATAGATAGAAASQESDSGEDGSDQGNAERPTASGIASIATSNDFRSLHLIATLYQYLGYLVVVGGAIAVIAAAASAGGGGAIVTLLLGAVGVAFYALLVFGIAAAIRLALAVEKSTRATAELLRERLNP